MTVFTYFLSLIDHVPAPAILKIVANTHWADLSWWIIIWGVAAVVVALAYFTAREGDGGEG